MDSSTAANGTSGKKTSSRLRNVVSYDEKRHMAEIEDDIQHGVAHTNLSELEERVNDLGESWETESLFEDALEDLAEDNVFTDGMSDISAFPPSAG